LISNSNLLGQLGVDRKTYHLIEPTPLIFENYNVTISDFSCGYFHTIIKSENNEIYSFGKNDFGQLGLGSYSTSVYFPQHVKFFSDKKIKKISTSNSHTLLYGDNFYYAFGENTVKKQIIISMVNWE
jgi:alpha-tubulin suppressor-like RCC1 family protein